MTSKRKRGELDAESKRDRILQYKMVLDNEEEGGDNEMSYRNGTQEEALEAGPKSSRFLVTINLNKTESGLAHELEDSGVSLDELKNRIYEVLKEYLSSKENYIPKNDAELSTEDIAVVSVQPGIWEIGHKLKRLNIHTKVEVVYRGSTSGYFHVNIQKLPEAVRRATSGITGLKWSKDPNKGPYANVRFVRGNSEAALTNYIFKEVLKNSNFSLTERNHDLYKERKNKRH